MHMPEDPRKCQNSPELDKLLVQARACTRCQALLPFEPNPILHLGPKARLMIIGQAPGTRVHKTGIPWNDPSGDNLRSWLGLTREEFYDICHIALMPMGFCYPGRGPSGDLPPRPECAPLWHEKIRAHLPELKLTLLIGRYAQAHYIKDSQGTSLTETVKAWRTYLPRGYFPLVHPSPRNRLWLKRNPWFEHEVIPALRDEIRRHLNLDKK